jgi:hypothetical protein
MTSVRMLLPPEPQYFWANLLFQAVGAAELAKGAGPVGFLPGQALPNTGAPIPDFNQNAPDLNATDPAYVDLITVEDFQAQPGHTVKMNRIVFADTTYTQASRRVQRSTIGTTAADMSGEQVSVTIDRYSGPLIAASGAVGPYVIEEYDARRMPIHSLAQRVGVHMRRDRFKFVDSVLGTLACTAPGTARYVYPGDTNNTLTTDNSAFLAQGDRPVDVESVLRAEQVALSNNIPTFANGRYLLVITPIQARQLQTSSKWLATMKNFKEKNPVFQHYLGTVGMTDIFVSNTNPTATANSTITVQVGVLLGPGALAFAMAMPCQVREDAATNYGQRIPCVWLADEGYEVLDNRFAVSLRSD